VRDEFMQRCEAGGVKGTFLQEAGDVPRRICERLRWADMLVIRFLYPPGSRPTSRLGSGFRTIIRRCPRPVLAIPWKAQPMNHALLAFDGSPKSMEALYVATYIARKWDTRLSVLTVGEKRGINEKTVARARAYLDSHGVDVTVLERSGNPGQEILNTSVEQKNDLVIMGGYGANPVKEVIFGSTVGYLLREITIPMLICR
jgi:nucleotide-binding universal stress UspA family protein